MSEARSAVVTGGTGALGSAVVRALLERGYSCHVPWFVEREVARSGFEGEPRVTLSGPWDLSEEAQVTAFYADVGPLWASVHVAGGFAMAPLTETSQADFDRMMAMNARSCFLCCREAVRAIRATGQGGGRLVNVAARPALVPCGGMVAYSASKAAVASITQSLSEELAGDGIWVNAVVPSIMDTPGNRRAMPDADHAAWPSVEDVARTIAFLASAENAVTRGGLVPVYGRS